MGATLGLGAGASGSAGLHASRLIKIITCVAGVHYDMPPPSRRAVCIGIAHAL